MSETIYIKPQDENEQLVREFLKKGGTVTVGNPKRAYKSLHEKYPALAAKVDYNVYHRFTSRMKKLHRYT